MTQKQVFFKELFCYRNRINNHDRTIQTTAPQKLSQRLSQRSHFISWLFISVAISFSPHAAIAQRIPIADGTLGNERSIVSPNRVINNLPSNQVDGGARRGANLFHSFREFNVDIGRGVYFTNPAGVTNILTRVTAHNTSEILGTLGVLGTANLFLINPNGILFGSNAQLDIRGSFLASTASSILFNNGFAFSATNSQAPPLLTVDVPIGLQFGNNPGAIRAQGAHLQVPNGQTLALIGGTVNVDGGELLALGGRVELAGVADAGKVGLTQQGQEWQLSLPDGLTRADVALFDLADVDVSSGGGGSIAMTARNVTISDRTFVEAGIAARLGTVGAQAGDIDINASEAVNISESYLSNEVVGTGNAGNINIATRSLALSKRAVMTASTFGQGNAGNINITARNEIVLDGLDSNGSASVTSSVNPSAVGQGGKISFTTGTLSFINGARVTANTSGQGDAGAITINARDTVSFDGVAKRFSGGAFSVNLPGAKGRSGDISITTGKFFLSNGATVSSSTQGQENAGNITITAHDAVSFDGVGSNGHTTGAASEVAGFSGQGGNITITTGTFFLTNGARVSTVTGGQGNAGNITITARDAVSFDGVGSNGGSRADSGVASGAIGQGGDIRITTGTLSLTNGGVLIALTEGQGNAGNIAITAKDRVSIDGVGSNGLPSAAVSQVISRAVGQGGDISITTGTLSLANGGTVSTSTFGQGKAGNIAITAKDRVSIDGMDRNGLSSSANSEVEFGAVGKGGDISITTGSLSLSTGGGMSTSTFGRGNAGNITITARDAVSFAGVSSEGFSSGAFSVVGSRSTGQGGRITIQTGLFSITNRGVLSASSGGQRDAGNLDVTARQIRLDNKGNILVQTASGQGGNITLQVQDLLLLRRGSLISATAGTAQAGGDGGNITINAANSFLATAPNENNDITANAFNGRGGNITINAAGIYWFTPRSRADLERSLGTTDPTKLDPGLLPTNDITAISQGSPNLSGSVTLNTPNLDPNRGLVPLPVDLTDASRLIVQTCPTGDGIAKQPNEFIITGRGGLPPTPSEAVNRDAIQVDLVTTDSDNESSVSHREPLPHCPLSALTPADTPIVEAQGWQIAMDGTVYLVAMNPPNVIAPWLDRLIHCR